MPSDPKMPDADDAPTSEDLAPPDPPEHAPTGPATNKKPAVAAPVPTHGEMASQEQLDEGERAVAEAEAEG
jgi:hypothetical protein